MKQTTDDAALAPIILTIDTTSTSSNVAVFRGANLLFCESDPEGRGEHAARLAPMVERATEQLRTQGLQLQAIALSAGPGSYTGLRIASSLAKGLCQGLSIPLIAISTLEAMAHAYIQSLEPLGLVCDAGDIICPMIDARRMEVYTATFTPTLERITADRAEILSGDTPFAQDLGSKTYHFVGGGASKTEGLWQASYRTITSLPPVAAAMGSLALEAYRAEAFADLAYWTPNYLKDYVAVVAKNKVLNR